MKRILSLLLICLPLVITAQTDAKYLGGAVPVVDGKVTFSIELDAPNMSKEQIHETILQWANARFQPDETHNDRVLYHNQEEGNIVVGGEEYIIFSKSSFALDRTRIYYLMQISSEFGKCNVSISRIRYWYNEARDGGEKYVAEEWITDKYAINKAKTKLYPVSGKFRVKTIDLKDELFNEIHSKLAHRMLELGLQKAPAAPASPNTQVIANQPSTIQKEQPLVPLQPAMPIEPVQNAQPATDMETAIAQAGRMTITAGNDEQFEISKECWGGFGELFGKKVVFCLIDTQKTMGNMLMLQSESYTISFYPSNSSQPSAIINCKKLMSQNIDGEEAKKMSPSCEVEKSYNMYVGEIQK